MLLAVTWSERPDYERAGGVGPGEAWGYRPRGTDPLVEVRVIRLGTNKPARVLVALVDDSFEGKEEWVPPARLKVLWTGAEQCEAREARWNRVASFGPAQEDPRSYAASEIVDEYLDEELGTINYRGGDSISLSGPELLAEQLNLQVEQSSEYPEAFTEDGFVIAPRALLEDGPTGSWGFSPAAACEGGN